MNYLKFLSMFAFAAMITLTGCKDDDDDNDTPPPPPPAGEDDLSLNVTGLPQLGSDYVYEGWIIVDDFPISTGTFTVDGDGDPSPAAFNVDEDELAEASGFMITIEPASGDDGVPSDTHILAGDFDGNSAGLTTDHDNSLGDDFDEATTNGSYLLNTPTTGDDTDNLSGVWFLSDFLGVESASLELPELPEGWKYEGWVVINDEPFSTGKFTQVDVSDEQDLYSGTEPAPEFPGEDFVTNAPDGHTFPVNLAGEPLFISIEPHPDNNFDAPFSMRPLVATIPVDPDVGESYDLDHDDSSIPSGVVTR